MLQPLNMTSHELDPLIREYRISFLKAVEKFIPSVLCDLEVIFERRFSDSELEQMLSKWTQHHRLYPWTIEIARGTMERWKRHSRTPRTTWKLPPVQKVAVWDEAPFLLRHRGFHPHIDGDLRTYAATVRRESENSLASYAGQMQSAKDKSVAKQTGQIFHNVQKRSRDGRDKNIAFNWLARNLAGTSLSTIANEAQVDRAAVVKQIKWAKSALSVE